MTKQAKEEVQLASPKAHFLDSGSFSLWTRAAVFSKENKCGEWKFYETDEFQQYLVNYADFVKKYHRGIEMCANVDVLPFRNGHKPPKGKDSHSLSYKNLKILESYGVHPVPVVHYTAPIEVWLRKYVEEGYPLIGLGGLVGSISDKNCQAWIDKCFDFVCQGGSRPLVKFHGFGVTSHEFLLRYPWYSVDSTTWTKHAAYGHILVPKKRNGQFILSTKDLDSAGRSKENWVVDCQPWLITMSEDSGKRKIQGALHYQVLKPIERAIVEEWLEFNKLPLGDSNTPGVTTHHKYRSRANLLFFEAVRESLPDYKKWSWASAKQAGFGLGASQPVRLPPTMQELQTPESKKLIIFYSGSASTQIGPEVELGEEANIMLTFHDMHKKCLPDSRFRRVLAARKRKRKALQGSN